MLALDMEATGTEATRRQQATVTFSQTATAIMILGLPRASKSIAHKINFLLQFPPTPKPKVSVLCPCASLGFSTVAFHRSLSETLSLQNLRQWQFLS